MTITEVFQQITTSLEHAGIEYTCSRNCWILLIRFGPPQLKKLTSRAKAENQSEALNAALEALCHQRGASTSNCIHNGAVVSYPELNMGVFIRGRFESASEEHRRTARMPGYRIRNKFVDKAHTARHTCSAFLAVGRRPCAWGRSSAALRRLS